MPYYAAVYMCFAVTWCERADLLALVCGVELQVCYFPISILGQVWYLIVLIPDLCTLTYFGIIFDKIDHPIYFDSFSLLMILEVSVHNKWLSLKFEVYQVVHFMLDTRII